MTGAAGLREGFADAGELRLHYVEAGSGDLVLLLHGFPQFWHLWRAQLEALGIDRHVVAPDLRGYNLSDKPEGVEAYRMRHLLADVRGLAAHFEAERFTLVGHDWAGSSPGRSPPATRSCSSGSSSSTGHRRSPGDASWHAASASARPSAT